MRPEHPEDSRFKQEGSSNKRPLPMDKARASNENYEVKPAQPKTEESDCFGIKGLGTDIVEIDRIRGSIERHGDHFLNRLFSQKELDYCYKFQDPAPHFAGRFAAKEAIAKALGTGFGEDLAWHDIEIVNDEKGKPVVKLSECLDKRGKVLLSISHCVAYAMATAILVR